MRYCLAFRELLLLMLLLLWSLNCCHLVFSEVLSHVHVFNELLCCVQWSCYLVYSEIFSIVFSGILSKLSDFKWDAVLFSQSYSVVVFTELLSCVQCDTVLMCSVSHCLLFSEIFSHLFSGILLIVFSFKWDIVFRSES